MRRLSVFNHITLDGYFVDHKGDMSWAHKSDPEFDEFVKNNASGEGELVFGRITYQMMASYWPTPMAKANNAAVAERMNQASKIVFSRTLEKADWSNTKLVSGDLVEEMRRMKERPGHPMVILGSGTIVAQLAAAGLIDEYQLVVNPVALGAGRTLFEGSGRVGLKLAKSRVFGNGNVFLSYEAT